MKKSRCLTPYSNRECFGQLASLSKVKNCHHWNGIPSTQVYTTQQNLQCFVKYSRTERAHRKVFHGRIFPQHTEKCETDQNGLWRNFIWLALLFLPRISTDSETDEILTRLTQSTHVYMCHAISFTSYDVSDLVKFPISQEVMLFCFFFFLSRVWLFVFNFSGV